MSELFNFSNGGQSPSLVMIDENFQTVWVYLLWNSAKDEEVKIQAVFGRNVSYDLQPIERFASGSKLDTIIYRLEYRLPMIDEDEMNSNTRNKYNLRLANKTKPTLAYYDDPKSRTIDINQPYQFLFDVQFPNNKRRVEDFCNQLCLYTYFLIKSDTHEQFTSMMDQFNQELSIDKTRKLTQHCLNAFFYICLTYLPQINYHLERNPNAMKIFLQMFGLLPIEKENFKFDNQSLSFLVAEFSHYMKMHFTTLLQTMDYDEWNLFSRGLTVFMTAQMLGNLTTLNTFHLIEQMKDYPDKQELIVNCLLKRLVEFRVPIRNDSWTKLFSLATDKYLLINCLDLVTSLDDYLVVLQYVIKHNTINEQMKLQLTNNFNSLIGRTDFTLTLENILRLLTCLQPQDGTSASSSTENIHVFQTIIKSSYSLLQKINSCLENVDMNRIHLETLRELFQLDHSVSILVIDKTNYLIKTIANRQNRTRDFYLTWFICFLCDKYYRNNGTEQQNFQRLLKTWLEYVKNDRDMLSEIIARLDTLLEHLQTVIVNQNDDYRLVEFQENMLATIFQPNLIYTLLIDISMKVNNKPFLDRYEKRFIEDLLVINANKLKSMEDPNNPLYQLLQVCRKVDPSTDHLLTNLVAACARLIQLNNKEILIDTFERPTKKTLTYTVLFDRHLNDLKLFMSTINELKVIWDRWTRTGLTLSDLRTWQGHGTEQRMIFNEIWDKVRQHSSHKESIENVFEEAERKFTEKESLIKAMEITLNWYCKRASDYSQAIKSIQDMSEELREKPIRSAETPAGLQMIEAIALKLSPFFKSNVWISYYDRHLFKPEEKSKTLQGERHFSSSSKQLVSSISTDSDDDEEDDWHSHSSSSASLPIDFSRQAKLTATLSKENSTVVGIIITVNKIFEEFHRHFADICTEWRREPISEWLQLFSNAEDVPSELRLLRTNLNIPICKELESILQLWEKQNFIRHVCQGCLNLATRLHFTIKEDDHDVLNTLIKLDEHILGEKCSQVYEEYLNRYDKPYSNNTLVIWSQFSIAIELIDFVLLLSSSDFENLLENVSDWDDKLVGAKTVRDFQTLRHYFDQVYKAIEQLQKDHSDVILPNILACFNSADIGNQVENIEEFFANCSSELSNMRHSHAELTDKERSKRRLIMSIMQKSSLKFIQNKKFDICLSPQGKNFSDLSELRDRVRLIEYSYQNKMKTDDEHRIQQLGFFIRFVTTIETILNTLLSLYIAGHPMLIEFIQHPKEFLCEENEFRELINLSEALQKLVSVWETTLCEKYILYPKLTYFSCKQFGMVEQFIHNPSECDEETNGYHLLRYIGIEPILTRPVDSSDNGEHTAEERLENLGRILSEQRIPGQSEKNRSQTKVFLIETNDIDLLKAMLSFCQRFNSTPDVNQLFFCSNETTWVEIRGFIYRAIYSREFHQLIRPELLSTSIQDQAIHLLRQLIEKSSEEFVCFGMITTASTVNLQIIDGLKSLQLIQMIHVDDLMSDMDFRRTVANLIKQCTIVTSRITGLGKTRTIREECVKIKKQYIKFPINGDVQADLLAKRLLKEARRFQTGAIHFDIGVIDNYHQINDLINCLVLFRSFCFGQIAISIPDETPIYIELDCSSHSKLFEHIAVFKHIPSIFIEHIDWKKFIPNKRVQFVANYLRAIKDKSILTKDIRLEDSKDLPVDECVRLIQHCFFRDQDTNYITWPKVFISIEIFHRLFLGFSQCSYFISEHLQSTQLRQSRMDILQAFFKSASIFTSKSVQAVREQQRAVNTVTTLKRNDIQQQQGLKDAIISWNQIQPFTLIFTSTDDPIFVYKTEKDIPESLKNYFDQYARRLDSRPTTFQKKFFPSKSVKTLFPEYKDLQHGELFEKLAKLADRKFLSKAICTKCFRQYEHETLMCEICKDSLDPLDKPVPIDEKGIEAFQKRIAKVIELEYVITADNFIKMLLVFLRVQSNVPVLIMGETGCGKTALINCLCQKILDDDLYVYRLHAGVTNEKLLEKMNELIVRAQELPASKRLWVFFDEFNTMFNISLLKEIVCERTLLGKALPNNMVFLGTCNPRRQKLDKPIFNEDVGIKKDRYDTLKLMHHRRNLFYNVTEIPETMLEYIWDYGYLDQATEKKYIEATLKTCKGMTDNMDLLDIVVNLISESQQFFREQEDRSSVSLRDVARFCQLYKWFTEYLSKTTAAEKLVKESSRLALLLCYYFRLDTKPNKDRYLDRLDRYLCPKYGKVPSTFVKAFKRLLVREEDRLIEQLQIPEDMARNQALKDNLFVLFPCIINHVPVFLCGKPGASKTSAVQILMNNLKGARSENPDFRKLPELVPVTFQGSQSCTSKSIEQIFERAEKYINIEKNSSLLPVVIFDEIGLAELSPHNPLKVLHEHLEIENCRFGFVGISNYRLDASKMNRALYIACLDPDDEDLTATGVFLSKINLNHNENNRLDGNLVRGLAQAYTDLQKRMQKEHKQENYFGLRDYYSLIKGIVHDCRKWPTRSQYEIIYQQLIINFGGINNGYEYFWEKFCSLIGQYDLLSAFEAPSPKELIQKCLTSRNSRHSMLIADRESTIDHIERYITTNPSLNGSVRTLVGSQFEGDLLSNGAYTEPYCTRVLMEIILHAETPITLVMRRMNHLYDSLYDLFNQNFTISGRKKYCRIALSLIYNPKCLVHDQFYCVILINAKDVDKSDPPFLNRFQKHYVQIEKLTQQRQWTLTRQLLEWLTNLPIPNVNTQFLLLRNLIVPYSPDYICDLIIDTCQGDDLADDSILNSCKQKLMRACSFDFPLVLSLNGNEDLIQQYYNIHCNLFNMSQLISATFEQTSPTKRIIYTYTQIYDTIHYENVEQICEIKLSSINTELEFINLLKTHTQTKNLSSILIIRINYHRESQHILSLKYNILNQWTELKDFHLWIIFHIQRNKLAKEQNEVLFNGWDILMIDDLNDKDKFISKEILLNPSYDYFINHYQYNFLEDLFLEFIHRTLGKFRYEILSDEEQTRRRARILDTLNREQDQDLRRIFQETIEYLMKKIPNPDQTRFKDWRYDLISNQYVSATSRSFHEACKSIISSFYDSYFILLIHHFEVYNLIDSYLYMKENQSTDVRYLWNGCRRLSLNTIDTSMMNVKSIEIGLIDDLRLPYSKNENQTLKQIRELFQTSLTEDEDDIQSFLMKLLKENSSYGEHLIESILNKTELLDLYYHDQLILFHMENKFQLSTTFILKLLTSNTRQKTMSRLAQLIVNPDELAEILRIFEDGFKLLTEQNFLKIMDRQIRKPELDDTVPNLFYSILFRNEKYHLLLPNTLEIDTQFEFHSLCDPFIEVSLVNLIEALLSPSLINQIGDIQQITSTYSSINQRVLKLFQYQVNNREKLCSFMSLLRCIKTLNPTQALQIFQKSCRDFHFDATFPTCSDIHQFIQQLEVHIHQQQGCDFDRSEMRLILLKLEVEFLKNWLVGHSDHYPVVLRLINQTTNNLWKYSAKIFSFIVGKLDLLRDIEYTYEPSVEQAEKINELDQHLHSIDASQYKLHRLFVNRIHLGLLSFPMDNQQIKVYLNDFYDHFRQSIQYVTSVYLSNSSPGESSQAQLILLLAWLKYYAQLYAFAFVNNFKLQHSDDIDHYLTDNRLSFCSTLKLFILKQILNNLNIDLGTFQTNVESRDIKWLQELFDRFNEERNRNERNLIFPIPLLQFEDEYIRVNEILNHYTDEIAIDRLIRTCSTNQYLCYCFYLWFIKYYAQNGNRNFQSNDQYRTLFQRKLSNETKIFLQPIGIQFLQMLCTNFSSGSYFHLDPSMSDRDIAIRLIILNVFAVCLSFRSFPRPNWINTILFIENTRIPTNYFEHLQSLCLFGLMETNRIKANMKFVRSSVRQRMTSGRTLATDKYIYQCSDDCLFVYNFIQSALPNQKSKCPFCHKEIGSSKDGNSLRRDPPQIRMTIEQGLRFIDGHITKCDQETKRGYYAALSSDQSMLEQRPDYLKSSISFRFLHLFLHSILFLLKEFEYLPNENLEHWDIHSEKFFPDHLEKDYALLETWIPDKQYCYVWIFQLLNGMLSGFEEPFGRLDSKVKVIEIEKSIEQHLINPLLANKMDEINNYKKTYMKYTATEEAKNTLTNFLDERTENDRRYPFLNFFNVTQVFQQDRLEEFFNHLKSMSHARTNYPLTMYVLEHIEDWSNIQYLYPLIQFLNYLRDKYNYRISRQQAVSKSIEECWNEKGEELYKNFVDAWSKINLNEVRYNSQIRVFDRHMSKDKKLAFFALNNFKDDSSIILPATLQTIARLQNDIVNYFHREIIQSTNTRRLPVHMIEKEHLLSLDKEFLNTKIMKHALVVNFEYGQSKELIYDYEEIEMSLRSLVDRLPLIDAEKFRRIQYQFELYSENNALINDVRHHKAQQQFDSNLRNQYRRTLKEKDDNDILQYLGSLDYIFTYIQHRNYRSNTSTIKSFVNQYIHSKAFLQQNAFLSSPFASIQLEYIIDLYEIIEEIAFDKIFRNHIGEKLNDQTIEHHQRKSIQERFIASTIGNEKIATSLKNINQWIGTLKRFMVRILPDYIDLNVPIETYLKRTDLWSCQIAEADLETIQLDESILLRHTFIVLLGLENRLNETEEHEQIPSPTTVTSPSLTNRSDTASLFRPSLSQRNISDKSRAAPPFRDS